MADVKPAIAEAVRTARRRQRISIRDLASRAGVSKAIVQRVELGSANYTIDTLAALTSVLNINVTI